MTAITHFDNAGGTTIPKEVIESRQEYADKYFFDPGCGSKLSAKKVEKLKEAEDIARDFVGAREEHDVLFGPTATQLIFTLSAAAWKHFLVSNGGGPDLRGNVVISDFCHEACSKWFQQRHHISVKIWKGVGEGVDKALPNDLDTIPVDEHTMCVILSRTSNITGRVLDVKKISEICKKKSPKCFVFVDDVAYVAHQKLDVTEYPHVDAHFVSFYKLYGPKVAMAAIRKDRQDHLPAIGRKGLTHPEKLWLGHDYESQFALIGWRKYLNQFGDNFEKIYAHLEKKETGLKEKFESELQKRKTFRVIGKPSTYSKEFTTTKWAPIWTIVPTVGDENSAICKEHIGKWSKQVVEDLANEGFAVRFGQFCSAYTFWADILEEVGVPGGLRVSLSLLNTDKEVTKFWEVMDKSVATST